MPSSEINRLGAGHLVTGFINATAGTAAVLSSNDNSATLTRTAAGDYTVTYGQAFRAAPVMTCIAVQAFTTLTAVTCQVVSNSVSATRFNVVLNTTSGTVTALADNDFYFTAIGSRDL